MMLRIICLSIRSRGDTVNDWKTILKEFQFNPDRVCCENLRRDYALLMEKHFDEKTSNEFSRHIADASCSWMLTHIKTLITSVAPKEAIDEARILLEEYADCMGEGILYNRRKS